MMTILPSASSPREVGVFRRPVMGTGRANRVRRSRSLSALRSGAFWSLQASVAVPGRFHA